MKQFLFFLCLFTGFVITAWAENDVQLLKGRWEMYVDLEGENYCYVIELNMKERSITSKSDEDGRKFYGYMDFSNVHHVYYYDIDSVYFVGDNLYAIRTINYDQEILYGNGISIDTIRYQPKTKQLFYIFYNGSWAFDYVPEIKPFVGQWEYEDSSSYEEMHLNLYNKIKAPDEYPFNGVDCYGWIKELTNVGDAYYVITDIKDIHYDNATFYMVHPDWPEDEPQCIDIWFNCSDGTIIYGSDAYILQPVGKHTTILESTPIIK